MSNIIEPEEFSQKAREVWIDIYDAVSEHFVWRGEAPLPKRQFVLPLQDEIVDRRIVND